MPMTRIDYEQIADAIAHEVNRAESNESDVERDAERRALGHIADRLARIMAAGNRNFDRPRFIAACRIGRPS